MKVLSSFNKNIVLIAIISLIALSCSAQNNTKTSKNSDTVNKEIKIKEVRDTQDSIILDQFLKRISTFENIRNLEKTTRKHLQYLIKSRPNEEENYYWIQVGYDNGFRLVIEYNYYAYPKSNKIIRLNTVKDTLHK